MYCRAKELGHLKLFENDIDISRVQLSFLQWLEIYNSLEIDLALGEKNINREIIEDDIRTDAYLLWKSRERKKFDKPKYKSRNKRQITPHNIPGVIFTKKRKRYGTTR